MPKSFCRTFFKGLNAIEKQKEANSPFAYTKWGVNQLKAVRDAGFLPVKGRGRAQSLALSYFLHQQFWPLKNEMHFSHFDLRGA